MQDAVTGGRRAAQRGPKGGTAASGGQEAAVRGRRNRDTADAPPKPAEATNKALVFHVQKLLKENEKPTTKVEALSVPQNASPVENADEDRTMDHFSAQLQDTGQEGSQNKQHMEPGQWICPICEAPNGEKVKIAAYA